MNLKKLVVASSLMLMPLASHAFDVGVGVKAGTVGAGVDLSVALSNTINARVALTNTDFKLNGESFTIGDAGSQADVNADLNMNFGATALMLDWYVFDGTFHLTAGMLKNNGSIDVAGTVNGTVRLDKKTYAADAIQSVGGSISAAKDFKPYLGLGWGRKASDEPGLSISIEAGVVLMSPSADLTAVLNPSRSTAGSDGLTQSQLDADIKTAEDDINNDLAVLETFPVISIGLNYAF